MILQHGDTGAHNMFFKKNPDGSAASETSAFIDWQIAYKGITKKCGSQMAHRWQSSAILKLKHPLFFGCEVTKPTTRVPSGNQFFDIARAVYGFTDAEVRREVEETIVNDYFEVLKDEMTKRGRSLDFGLDAVTSFKHGEVTKAFAFSFARATLLLQCTNPAVPSFSLAYSTLRKTSSRRRCSKRGGTSSCFERSLH